LNPMQKSGRKLISTSPCFRTVLKNLLSSPAFAIARLFTLKI